MLDRNLIQMITICSSILGICFHEAQYGVESPFTDYPLFGIAKPLKAKQSNIINYTFSVSDKGNQNDHIGAQTTIIKIEISAVGVNATNDRWLEVAMTISGFIISSDGGRIIHFIGLQLRNQSPSISWDGFNINRKTLLSQKFCQWSFN